MHSWCSGSHLCPIHYAYQEHKTARFFSSEHSIGPCNCHPSTADTFRYHFVIDWARKVENTRSREPLFLHLSHKSTSIKLVHKNMNPWPAYLHYFRKNFLFLDHAEYFCILNNLLPGCGSFNLEGFPFSIFGKPRNLDHGSGLRSILRLSAPLMAQGLLIVG